MATTKTYIMKINVLYTEKGGNDTFMLTNILNYYDINNSYPKEDGTYHFPHQKNEAK
jgi:hypothetical protein